MITKMRIAGQSKERPKFLITQVRLATCKRIWSFDAIVPTKGIEDRTEKTRDLRKTRSKLAPSAHGQRVLTQSLIAS